MFKIRAVLASLLCPSWGIYAGFELFEHVARPGAEEYLDNEKYELRPRDWAAAEAQGRSLAPFMTTSTASGATTRPCTGCATCASTTSTTRRCCAGPSTTPTPATR